MQYKWIKYVVLAILGTGAYLFSQPQFGALSVDLFRNVQPTADQTYDLGVPSSMWRNFHTLNATTTNLDVLSTIKFDGITGDSWDDFFSVSSGGANNIATTTDIGESQLAFFNKTSGTTTLSSVATGTISETGLVALSATRSAVGGDLTISLDNIAANSVVGNLTGSAAAPTAFATSSLFAAGVPGYVLMWNGSSWAPNATATCVQITGAAALCDGEDAGDLGLTTLNTLVTAAQLFATGSSGTDFNISSLVDTHTFNIPSASASNRGLVTSTDWSIFTNKISSTTIDTESELETFLTDVSNVFTNNDGALNDDDLTNNSIEDLSDVSAMTENFGDLLHWNGSSWADLATSSLDITATGLGNADFGDFTCNGSSCTLDATYVQTSRQLTVAGTANQITSSAGAQDLSADRTWTLSLPSHVVFPSSFQVTRATTTHATTTNLDITSLLTFNGVTGSTWASFCTTITGGSGLCDGTDDGGAGGGSPGGSATELQYRVNSSTFGAISESAYNIPGGGNVGFGSTTPWAKFTAVGGGTSTPIAVFATTSTWTTNSGQQPVLLITATTTGSMNYSRVAIGTTSPWGASGLRDQFTVDGRIYSTYRHEKCDIMWATVAVSADATNICPGFHLDETTDGDLHISSTTVTALYPGSVVNGISYINMTPGSTPAVGDGIAIRTPYLGSREASPVFEAIVYVPTISGTHTISSKVVGFSVADLVAGVGAASTTIQHPTNGAYFAATSTSGWWAITRDGTATTSTNLSLSTSTPRRLRVELTPTEAIFIANGTVVAVHTTNLPRAGINLSAGVWATIMNTVVGARTIRVGGLRVWVDDPPSFPAIEEHYIPRAHDFDARVCRELPEQQI